MKYEIYPIDEIDFQKNYTDGTCLVDGCKNPAEYCVVIHLSEEEDGYCCEEHLPK